MLNRIEFQDEAGTFAVSVLPGVKPSLTVVFAVGGGGNPDRHMPLLAALAERGATVLAPHFERLVRQPVAAADLALRIRRMRLVLDHAAGMGRPVRAAGHSIGAAVLIGLAGGAMWLYGGERLDIAVDRRIERMALFTPAMDFFKAPGALDKVRIPIQAWAGSLDPVTPPSQTEFLKHALGPLVDARFIDGAGHFSFMHELPPNVVDTVQDREAFLDDLVREVADFLL